MWFGTEPERQHKTFQHKLMCETLPESQLLKTYNLVPKSTVILGEKPHKKELNVPSCTVCLFLRYLNIRYIISDLQDTKEVPIKNYQKLSEGLVKQGDSKSTYNSLFFISVVVVVVCIIVLGVVIGGGVVAEVLVLLVVLLWWWFL